jgi:hypothetical protein
MIMKKIALETLNCGEKRERNRIQEKYGETNVRE